MNKIHSLKYCSTRGTFIAVSEHAKNHSSSTRKKTVASIALLGTTLLASPVAYAAISSNQVPYLIYRDFAENKGMFTPGATNIPIYTKSGDYFKLKSRLVTDPNNPKTLIPQEFRDYNDKTVLMKHYNEAKAAANDQTKTLGNIPMLDFSGVTTTGLASLINPQFVISVAHDPNTFVQFGGSAGNNNHDLVRYDYQYVSRNEHYDPTKPASDKTGNPSNFDYELDYMNPRLNKLVTEAAPYDMPEDTSGKKLLDRSRYPVAYRMGAGTAYIKDVNENKNYLVKEAFVYQTGGVLAAPTLGDFERSFHPGFNGEQRILTRADFSLKSLGDLATFKDPSKTLLPGVTEPGDSGSPAFMWDAQENKWVVVGTLNGAVENLSSYWTMAQPTFFKEQIDKYTDPNIKVTADGGDVKWKFSLNTGTGTLTQGANTFDMHGIANATKYPTYNQRLNDGKNLTFEGADGKIVLETNVFQGAGALTFDANYTVAPTTNETWRGGGLNINADKKVIWQVNGVGTDSLHKIGQGTLEVNAKGINTGELSVGDGTVILNQQADDAGKKQAFSFVNIVSGRPTVVLNSSDQVNNDNITFGYRGGRLDLNGNSLTVKRIRHTDSGARVVNNNATQKSTINIKGHTISDVSIITDKSPDQMGVVGDIYTVYNINRGTEKPRQELFKLKISAFGSTIAVRPNQSNLEDYWEFLGPDTAENRAIVSAAKLKEMNQIGFEGYLGESDSTKTNGEMDLNFDPVVANSTLYLSGGANVNGNITVKNTDPSTMSNTLLLTGSPTPHAADIVIDDDWITRDYSIKAINLDAGSKFQLGEYANLNGNINAQNKTTVTLGYYDVKNNESVKNLRCYRLQGSSYCSEPIRTSEELAKLPTAMVTGDINLGEEANLFLGKVDYKGALTGPDSANATLSQQALWRVSAQSRIGSLNTNLGTVDLSGGSTDAEWQPKELTVKKLNANGTNFKFGISSNSTASDHLNITESASGANNTIDVNVFTKDIAAAASAGENVITLISAPLGTATNLFTVKNIQQGFTLFKPNSATRQEGAETQWILNKKEEAPVVVEPTVVEPPKTPTTPTVVEPVTEPTVVEPPKTPTTPTVVEPVTEPTVVEPPKTPTTPTVVEPVTEPTVVEPPKTPTTPTVVEPVTEPTVVEPPKTPTTPTVVEPVTEPTVVEPPKTPTTPTVVEPVTEPTVVEPPKTPTTPTVVEPAKTPATPSEAEPAKTPADPTVVEPTTKEPATVVNDTSTPAQSTATTPSNDDVAQPTASEVLLNRYFTQKDNQTLIDQTMAVLSSRDMAFSQAAGKLQNRNSNIHFLNQANGPWAQVSVEKRSYNNRSLKLNTISIGADKNLGPSTIGMQASYTKGEDTGSVGKIGNTQGGVGVYYSWQPAKDGIFVDLATGYQRINEKLDFAQELGSFNGSAQTNMIMASSRVGYKATLPGNVFIAPSAEVFGGHVNGYTLKNDDVSITQTSGNPLYLKAGVQIGKTWQQDPVSSITVSTGLYRKQSITSSGPKVILSDKYATRRYPGWKDNGYEINLKVSGNVTPALSLYLNAETTIGNKGKTDNRAQFGTQYKF